MNVSKILILVFIVLLWFIVGYAVMVEMSNMELRDELLTVKNNLSTTGAELNSKEAELNSIKAGLSSTEVTLQETLEKLNISQRFITNFFTAEGKFRAAKDMKENTDVKYILAGEAYADDNWDTAITYYGQAITDYSNAGQRYTAAGVYYNTAENNTDNPIYQNLCNAYEQLCSSASNRTYYLYKTVEYMQSACSFYKSGDYDSGGSEVDMANVWVNKHADEVTIYNDLYAEVGNILIQLSYQLD